MKFNEKLTTIRKENGLSQEQLGEKLDVARQTISKWELGETTPEMDKLIKISELFKISLDELMKDIDVNNNQKLTGVKTIEIVRRVLKSMLKNRKLCLMIFTLLCFIAIGTCTIVDLAINNKITWGIYPILSIPFGYIIIAPLFVKKHGIVLSLSLLILTTLPFLYFMEKAISMEKWFYSLALPITIASGISILAIYSIICFFKINAWYKASIILFICGVILSPIINYIVNNNIYWYDFINIFSCIVISAVCGIYGYIKTTKKN